MTDWSRGSIEDIAIAEIILEDDLQPRCGIDAVLVGEYADALAGGHAFPPVVVFREGTWLYLADGFHRLKAHQSLGKAEILCAVSSGSPADALRYSLSANAAHGRPRTGGDMARAYRAAKKAGIVEPGDVAGVIKTLACSPAWAYRLTEEDRGSALSARAQAIRAKHAEGKTHKQIGKDLGLSTRTVTRVLGGQNSTVEICPPDPDAGRIDGRRLSVEQIKTLHRGECPFSEWPPLRKDGTRISKPELFSLFLSLSPEESSLMGVLLQAASEAQHERFRLVVERLRTGLDAGGKEVDDLDPDTLSEMRYFVEYSDEIYEDVLAESTDSDDWGLVDDEAIGRATRRCMARGQVGAVEMVP